MNIADIKDAADNDDTPEAVDDCIYKLDDKLLSGDNLLKAKYDYDETGIYVPYTAEYQAIGVTEGNFHTADNIFLKTYRIEETRKDILIRCEWTLKTSDGYEPTGIYFNIECEWPDILEVYAKLKDDGTVKSNKLNQKARMTGNDAMVPASEGSYVNFIEDMRKDILRCNGLEVLKDKDYEWPEIPDEDEDDDHAAAPSCFNEYPEDIQDGAMYLINNNLLLDNIIRTVSYVQYGNKEVKRSLILTPTTPYVKEPLHTLLDGKRGGGKTALIMEIVKNFPNKDIFHYQSFSAKNIFYDKDKFNPDGVNILILDDPNLNNDERVETLKILSDNEKPVKTLKTVINQKAEEFELTGKFLIIITYAKEIPDEELANRLHNTSLIIADSEKIPIKNKIKTNAATDIKNNAAVMKMREYNKAAIQYLSEKNMRIFNLFTLFLNVDDFNNRDISDLISIIIANSFYNYSKLKSITVNDMELVIGSFNEIVDNLKSWNEDEYQSEKLSSRQKEMMDLLPEYTDEDMEDEISKVMDEIADYDSVNAKIRVIESKFYTINRIAKEMEMPVATVNNALNRNHKEGSTTRSLAEMDLVHKIQIDSSYVQTHPNIFYKPIKETKGASSNDDEDNHAAMYILFTKLINTLNGKQSILINLLIYVNITLNKKGYTYLKNYCSSYDGELSADDYDSYYDFIHDFMEGLTEDHYININAASVDDLISSTKEMEKINIDIPADIHYKVTKLSNISENALNENPDKEELCKPESHSLHTSKISNKDRIKEMGYSYMYVQKLSSILSDQMLSANEILSSNYYNFDMWPDDPDTNDKVWQLVGLLKKLDADDLITSQMVNGTKKYTITAEQYAYINGSDTA